MIIDSVPGDLKKSSNFKVLIWYFNISLKNLDTPYTNMVELTGMLKYDSVYLSAWVEVLDSREKLEKSIVGHS